MQTSPRQGAAGPTLHKGSHGGHQDCSHGQSGQKSCTFTSQLTADNLPHVDKPGATPLPAPAIGASLVANSMNVQPPSPFFIP